MDYPKFINRTYHSDLSCPSILPQHTNYQNICRISLHRWWETQSAVRNSKHFVDFISSQQLDEEVLVSFDVVSLFTNIPIDLAIQTAQKYLENDDTLEDRTQLEVDNIILLLELCLNATYLQFNQICYQQRQGTAMGSPVSVTIANLVMEDVEQRALSSFSSTKPLFWKRYVR